LLPPSPRNASVSPKKSPQRYQASPQERHPRSARASVSPPDVQALPTGHPRPRQPREVAQRAQVVGAAGPLVPVAPLAPVAPAAPLLAGVDPELGGLLAQPLGVAAGLVARLAGPLAGLPA